MVGRDDYCKCRPVVEIGGMACERCGRICPLGSHCVCGAGIPAFLPSPDQIRAASLEIQRHWTPYEERLHRAYDADHRLCVFPPGVPLGHEDYRHGDVGPDRWRRPKDD